MRGHRGHGVTIHGLWTVPVSWLRKARMRRRVLWGAGVMVPRILRGVGGAASSATFPHNMRFKPMLLGREKAMWNEHVAERGWLSGSRGEASLGARWNYLLRTGTDLPSSGPAGPTRR